MARELGYSLWVLQRIRPRLSVCTPHRRAAERLLSGVSPRTLDLGHFLSPAPSARWRKDVGVLVVPPESMSLNPCLLDFTWGPEVSAC